MKAKNLKLAIIAVIFITVLTSSFIGIINSHKVYAATAENELINYDTNIEELNDVEPYGVFTSLSISINGGNGKVWATVKNDFTLFPATVIVVVMLYSSESYTESYESMDLVSTNTTNDLNMGKTVSTEASTGGVAKYWIARMRYKIDSKSWASKATEVCKIGADGEFLGYV